MPENADQYNSEYGHFSRSVLQVIIHQLFKAFLSDLLYLKKTP